MMQAREIPRDVSRTPTNENAITPTFRSTKETREGHELRAPLAGIRFTDRSIPRNPSNARLSSYKAIARRLPGTFEVEFRVDD